MTESQNLSHREKGKRWKRRNKNKYLTETAIGVEDIVNCQILWAYQCGEAGWRELGVGGGNKTMTDSDSGGETILEEADVG